MEFSTKGGKGRLWFGIIGDWYWKLGIQDWGLVLGYGIEIGIEISIHFEYYIGA